MVVRRREPQRTSGSELHCLQVAVAPRAANAVRELLVQRFSAGFEERTTKGRVSFVLYAPHEAAIAGMREELAVRLASFPVQFRAEHKAVDWQSAWIAHLGPQPLTARTTVVPVKGRVRAPRSSTEVRKLYLLQQAAFGFGEHPTTRLMAGEIERLLEDKQRTVLDVGTGTGVLGILAALRGARRVRGIDIDGPSVKAANANAALNGVSRRCRFEQRPLQQVKERFDLVLANLDLVTLKRLSRSLRRVSEPGAVLLLSGVLSEDAAAVTAIFSKLGFRLHDDQHDKGWALLHYRAPA